MPRKSIIIDRKPLQFRNDLGACKCARDLAENNFPSGRQETSEYHQNIRTSVPHQGVISSPVANQQTKHSQSSLVYQTTPHIRFESHIKSFNTFITIRAICIAFRLNHSFNMPSSNNGLKQTTNHRPKRNKLNFKNSYEQF